MGFIRPSGPNALRKAVFLYCDLGSIKLEMYAFSGLMSGQVFLSSKEVHCFNASLSEQDFERVDGLSPLAGLY